RGDGRGRPAGEAPRRGAGRGDSTRAVGLPRAPARLRTLRRPGSARDRPATPAGPHDVSGASSALLRSPGAGPGGDTSMQLGVWIAIVAGGVAAAFALGWFVRSQLGRARLRSAEQQAVQVLSDASRE